MPQGRCEFCKGIHDIPSQACIKLHQLQNSVARHSGIVERKLGKKNPAINYSLAKYYSALKDLAGK